MFDKDTEKIEETFKSSDEVVLKDGFKEGYDFIGWYEITEDNVEVKVESLENRDYILYAKYEKSGGCGSSMIKLFTTLSVLFMIIIKRRK